VVKLSDTDCWSFLTKLTLFFFFFLIHSSWFLLFSLPLTSSVPHTPQQFRRITWELIESEQPTEASAAITTIRCFRITETNGTFVEW
jgi:hypothetical protein